MFYVHLTNQSVHLTPNHPSAPTLHNTLQLPKLKPKLLPKTTSKRQLSVPLLALKSTVLPKTASFTRQNKLGLTQLLGTTGATGFLPKKANCTKKRLKALTKCYQALLQGATEQLCSKTKGNY